MRVKILSILFRFIPTHMGNGLSDSRPKREQPCAVCGKVFITVGRGTYCSNACRQKAKYARKRAESAKPS